MVLLASAYDQSRFFKSDDLTQEKKFRIKNVTEELIGTDRDREMKLVVWFTNDKHGLVLNRVNNRTIRGAYGDTVADWADKIIVIFPTMVEFRGKLVPSLRVRIPPPKSSAPVSPPQPTPSGNGKSEAAAPSAVPPPVVEDDPELAADPVKPLSDEMDDEIPF